MSDIKELRTEKKLTQKTTLFTFSLQKYNYIARRC